VIAALTHDLKVFNSSLPLNDELGDQVEVGNVVTKLCKIRSSVNRERTELVKRLSSSHSTPVELFSVHVSKTFPWCDRLERRRLFRCDKVLTDRKSRVAGEAYISITEGKFRKELDHIVPIFGVLCSKKLDVTCESMVKSVLSASKRWLLDFKAKNLPSE
jgi:hypothetical protein